MHSVFCFWAAALPLIALLSPAVAARLPVEEVFRKNQFLAKERLTRRDLICIEDDWLLAFQQYTDTTYPFCSSYLGIPLATATSIAVTKTLLAPL